MLLAANPARIGGVIVNDSASILYIKFGTGASATSFDYAIDGKTTVPGLLEVPGDWKGIVHGFWVSADGSARVSERTA